jgi:hypothetical protein
MTPETKELVERLATLLNDNEPGNLGAVFRGLGELGDYLVEAEFATWSEQRGYSVRVPNALMENPTTRCNACGEYRNYHANHCTCEF